MGGENCEKQHVDEVNGSCYGKLNLYRKRDGSYSGFKIYCEGCRLKEPCINASREEREHAEQQLSNISFEDGLKSDTDDRYDDDGAPVINPVENSLDMEALLAENREPGRGEDFYMILLRRYGNGIREEDLSGIYPAFREVISQFLYEFVHMPKSIIVSAGKAVNDMTQTELARRENITRQAVCAAIKTEQQKFRSKGLSLPKNLSGREKAVFVLQNEGLSVRECAKVLKISKSRVHQIGQKTASKGAVCWTGKKRGKKKRGKNDGGGERNGNG